MGEDFCIITDKTGWKTQAFPRFYRFNVCGNAEDFLWLAQYLSFLNSLILIIIILIIVQLNIFWKCTEKKLYGNK